MKRRVVFLIVFVLIFFRCGTNKKTEYTILGEYTPTQYWLIEKLNGKVEKLTEKFYWGVADGDNVVKGNLITSKEADSQGWGYIYELNFDPAGTLLGHKKFTEKNEYIGGWQFFIRNDRPDSAQRIWHDTVKIYDKLKYNRQGVLTEVSEYNANNDTLVFSWTKTISRNEDTVEYKVYNKEGELTWKTLHLFDEKGLFVGYEYYGPDGTQKNSARVTNNEEGFASEIVFFDGNKNITNVMMRSYEYDHKGNWIKMAVKNNKGEMNVHERTITYYK